MVSYRLTAVRTNGVFALGRAWLEGREVAVVQIGPKVLRTDTDDTWHQGQADDLGMTGRCKIGPRVVIPLGYSTVPSASSVVPLTMTEIAFGGAPLGDARRDAFPYVTFLTALFACS